MTYEMCRYIFIGGLVACGIFFVIAVILFFTLKIHKIISDLTGRTARKAIEDIRTQNEQPGNKPYQFNTANLRRGRSTDKGSLSGRLERRNETPPNTDAITEKISRSKMKQPASETSVLTATQETSVLTAPVGETNVLTPAEPFAQAFTVEYEITFVHTREVIT